MEGIAGPFHSLSPSQETWHYPLLPRTAKEKGVAEARKDAIIFLYWPGRGGGIGRHAVLRGQWACACVGSNPALGTTFRSGGLAPRLATADVQGDVAKWLRRRSAKPLCGGSNPPVASNSFSLPASYSSRRRLAPSALQADFLAPRRWTLSSSTGTSGCCGAPTSAPTPQPGCNSSVSAGWSRTCPRVPPSAACWWCRLAQSTPCPASS